jgi:hypothetical protein
LYREWTGRLMLILRQVHTAGERLFVDFAGHTMEVIDAATGEIQRAEIFVAVLGASSFIYAEATGSQALADWIGAHVKALNAIGGVPRQIVSDNLKAGGSHRGPCEAWDHGGQIVSSVEARMPAGRESRMPLRHHRSFALTWQAPALESICRGPIGWGANVSGNHLG